MHCSNKAHHGNHMQASILHQSKRLAHGSMTMANTWLSLDRPRRHRCNQQGVACSPRCFALCKCSDMHAWFLAGRSWQEVMASASCWACCFCKQANSMYVTTPAGNAVVWLVQQQFAQSACCVYTDINQNQGAPSESELCLSKAQYGISYRTGHHIFSCGVAGDEAFSLCQDAAS